MKRLIGAVVVFMACLVFVGGAFAYDYTDHVSMAPNGKGDLLFFPVYMAMGGDFPIQTNLSVVNTSETHCVVAKVVFRSYAFSEELLDFFIYLSPTDMWVGRIEYGPNGPRVVSSDASGPTLVPGQALTAATCKDDTNQMGYVEIIEAWSDNTLGKPPVAKLKIKEAYEASVAPYTAAQTVNTLAGSYQIAIPTIGWEASDNAYVMKDYDNIAKLSVVEETTIGVNNFARNSLQEIEAAMSKDNLAMNFNSSADTGGTLHVFSFPTKLSDFDPNCSRAARFSKYFYNTVTNVNDGIVHFHMKMFDNEEHTTVDPENPFSPQRPEDVFMKDEVEIRSVPSGIFNFGWALYSFDKKGTSGKTYGPIGAPNDLTYKGTPVLPVIIDFNKGLSIRQGVWTDTDVVGVINGNNVTLNGYQLSSSYATTVN